MTLRTASIVSITCAVGMGGCSADPVTTTVAPRPVQFVQVRADEGRDRQTYSGVTKSHVDAYMSFKVGGTVLDRPVVVGQSLAKDQLLASLDPRDYRVAYQEAQAALAAGNAALRNAEANYERIGGLYENRNASKAELDAARASAESARAQVAAAREQVEGARLQLSYTRISSPDDCSVAETLVRENENVAPGQPVLRLTCGACPEAEAYLPETHIGLVEQGMHTTVTVDAFPGQEFSAVVTEVSVASNAAGTTFPVTVALDGDCPDMRSGLATDVHFTFSQNVERGRVDVPTVAVGEDREGNFVFVLEQAGDSWFARRRSVTVGDITDHATLLITDGLAEGEYIATAGVRRIQDGLEVRLLEGGRLAL